MKKKTIKNLTLLICMWIAIVVLFILGSIYDLQISQKVVDTKSDFAKFFAIVGEYPAYFLMSLCSCMIFYNANRFNKKIARVTLRLVTLIVSFLSIFLLSMNAEYANSNHLVAMSLVKSLLGTIFFLVFVQLFEKKDIEKTLKVCVYIIVFIIIAFLVNKLLKTIVCRMRYRDMLAVGSVDGYTPWYRIMMGKQPTDYDYDLTSFPSGHASSVTNLLALCWLVDCMPSLRPKRLKKSAIKVVCYLMIILTCIARVIIGAHFVTDVIAGSVITYLLLVLTKAIYYRKRKTE